MVMSRLLYGQLRMAMIGAAVADESHDDYYKYESGSLNTSVPLKEANDIHQTVHDAKQEEARSQHQEWESHGQRRICL